MINENNCKVRLFGRPNLVFDGQNIAVPEKLLALLALLSASPARKISRADAVGKLWGASETHKANASFRQFLVRIRKIETKLGIKILKRETDWISYNEDCLSIDLDRILRADIATAIRNGNTELLMRFAEATEAPFFQTEALQDEAFEEWKQHLRAQLTSKITTCLISLLESEAAVESTELRVQLATRLIETDPSSELGYRILMEHYCEIWDRPRARQIYQQCAETLLTDYGVEPELSTRQLASALGLTAQLPGQISAKPPPGSSRSGSAAAPPTISEPDRIGVPRILLLPPNASSIGCTNGAIVEALLDDVTTGLTRYRSITVLAGHSARHTAQSLDLEPTSIGERYGVQYMIKSSMLPSDGGSVANFLLLDCRTNASLAAFNAKIDNHNLGDVYSRIGREIVYRFVSAIEQREIELPSATERRTAYRLYLEGRLALWHNDLPDLRRARCFFQRSIEVSGRFAPAHSGLSRTLSMEHVLRGMTSTDLLKRSLEAAETSIHLDPQDGRGFRERGFCNLYLRRHDESLQSYAAAEASMPNDADLLADYADALSHNGLPNEALEKILYAKSLNPHYPNVYDWAHAGILYQLEDYEGAISILSPLNEYPGVSRLLTAAFAMVGDFDSARRQASILQSNYPDFNLERLSSLIPDRSPQDTLHLLEGLRKAGLY